MAALRALLVLVFASALASATFVHEDEGFASCPGGTRRFVATISALKNMAPNSTKPMPNPLSPVKGAATLCVDESAKRADWKLRLCGFSKHLTGGYTAAHLHVGADYVDYPPPLVPLEPAAKPADPTAPPTKLPQLSPPLVFTGCRDSQGSFGEGDLVPLPDSPLPTVEPVTSFGKLVSKLDAGDIYANVHSVVHPAGEARGNFAAA